MEDIGRYEGTDVYEWMEGGFFLVHRFDGVAGEGNRVRGVEYIGFDEDTKILRSHMIGARGENFTYTWDVEYEWTVWFGDKGSDNFWRAKFSEDGDKAAGRWQWPEGGGGVGGYRAKLTRVKAPKRPLRK